MDTKANLNHRKKLNELAIQHNRLTTLVSCLLNEVTGLKQELSELKGGVPSSSSKEVKQQSTNNNNNSRGMSNFSDLRAEEILRQLSINTSTIDN